MIIKVEQLKDLNLSGKTIAFPTDTVYGVGALLRDEEAIHKIYELKQRDYSKPLAILVADEKQIEGLVKDFQMVEKASGFWPGAITFIFEKGNVPDIVSPFPSVGIRIPDSEIARSVLRELGPMAVTSVNLSGKPSATSFEEVSQFDIDYIIKGPKGSDIASTVVDLLNNKILREGTVTRDELLTVFRDLK